MKNAKNYFIEAKMYKLTESVIPRQTMFQPWASEGFFPGGTSRGFSQNFFQGGGTHGEIWFLPLEIEKTTFFANNFKIQKGKAPPRPPPSSDAHGFKFQHQLGCV